MARADEGFLLGMAYSTQRGYGAVHPFTGELQEDQIGPAQNPEFVLMHGDNVDASGFVQHIKLPHYVDFQAELSLIRQLRERKHAEEQAAAASEKHAEASHA